MNLHNSLHESLSSISGEDEPRHKVDNVLEKIDYF